MCMLNSDQERSCVRLADREDTTHICDCGDCSDGSQQQSVKNGDIVRIALELIPENGFIPEPLFDAGGEISFVVGWGNYLPALHDVVMGKKVGDTVSSVSVDAGWGERNEDLVMEIPRKKLYRFQQQSEESPSNARFDVGTIFNLSNGIQLSVVEDKGETVVVDANAPLAGASYSCSFEVLNIEELPEEARRLDSNIAQSPLPAVSRYHISTWALGCFWGGELAFMRVPGVVGTRVGYSQGITRNPSYEDVCKGKTHHRESIMVVYDPEIVSYKELMTVALERLAATKRDHVPKFFHNMFMEDEHERNSKQYKYGFYFHSEEQEKIARNECESMSKYKVELLPATTFYIAEEYHQQYLLKGGQSGRKGAKETIRCYG